MAILSQSGKVGRLRQNIAKYRRLPPLQRRALHRAAILLPAVALLLKLLGYRRTLVMLTRWSPRTPAEGAGENAALAIARGVTIAACHAPYRGNCLKRSLTLWFLLRRQGIAAELRIGTRKTDGVFEAHAWVEYHGLVLNDLPDVGEHYGAFAGDVARIGGFE